MQKCKIKENTNNYNSSANIIYDTGTKYHKSDIYKYLSLDEKRLFEIVITANFVRGLDFFQVMV